MKNRNIGSISDSLYGSIPYTESERRLFATPEMRRLKNISHSATPDVLAQTTMCTNKFDHSLGMAYLTGLATKCMGWSKELSFECFCAALFHDAMTPFGTHHTERFLNLVYGVDHEGRSAECVFDSDFGREARSQGASLENVQQLILGELPPWSRLINAGSRGLDVDNIDGLLRFGTSKGMSRKVYDPLVLACGYRWHREQLVFAADVKSEIDRWVDYRSDVFDQVYQKATLASAAMFLRALDFAYQENQLTPAFFTMTDHEATKYLIEDCNSRTRKLFELARDWQFYHCVYAQEFVAPHRNLEEYLSNILTMGEMADNVTAALELDPLDVVVFTGRHTGYKKLTLDCVKGDGNCDTFKRTVLQPMWLLYIYAVPGKLSSNELLALDGVVGDSIYQINNVLCAS